LEAQVISKSWRANLLKKSRTTNLSGQQLADSLGLRYEDMMYHLSMAAEEAKEPQPAQLYHVTTVDNERRWIVAPSVQALHDHVLDVHCQDIKELKLIASCVHIVPKKEPS
jgi:hypothetical protein